MKRLAALLLAAVLAALILQPIAAGVNNSLDNNAPRASGVPIPPFPPGGDLVASGVPIPPFPPGGYTPA